MENFIASDIEKLINLTTIVRVDDNLSRITIFGDEIRRSRFVRDQGQQVDLNDLESNWNNKWKSFGNNWNEERQNYRFLEDSFKLFYFSFERLRFYKVACINEAFGNKNQMFHFNELTGVSMYGMYHHGKKCIDLLKTLNLITEKHTDWDFCKKFSETRNKLIEHNFNPYGLALQIEPSIWSLASRDSFLKVYIHKSNIERVFDAYVDYYEDYYRLEKIITDIIKKF
jgi:hypothetical protein